MIQQITGVSQRVQGKNV